MNYLARARKTFVEYSLNVPYNLLIVSCILARRNHSFPDICKILEISKLLLPLKEK